MSFQSDPKLESGSYEMDTGRSRVHLSENLMDGLIGTDSFIISDLRCPSFDYLDLKQRT